MRKIIAEIFFFVIQILCVNIYAQLPKPDHIVIVIEENHGYDQIINNSDAPYINNLATDSQSALFTDSHGVTHPSQPNYLFLFSGTDQGVTNDNLPALFPFTSLNLGAELIKKGLTFTGYSEDLPGVGFNGASSGQYKRKHNPWVNWQNADSNGIPSNLNVPLSDFPTDFNFLPTVSIVVPNQDNDMHDGSISMGDTWLQNKLDSYIQWAKTHNSLLILTFDEDDFTTANKIVTIITGQSIKGGTYAKSINHLNILRTIEEIYGTRYAGISNDSSAITDCWVNTTGIEKTNKIDIPATYKLFQNFPNPFNPASTIKYILPETRNVKIVIYDSLGRTIKTLVDKLENAGIYEVKFEAEDLPSGIYFYSLSSNNFNMVRKALLLK